MICFLFFLRGGTKMEHNQLSEGKIQNKTIYLALISVILVGAIILSIIMMKNEVIAKVGSENITKDELNEMLVEQYGTSALETLISDKIIELEAAKEKVSIAKKEKDAEFQSLIDSYGGQESFTTALEENGMTMEEMGEQVERYLTVKKLVEPRVEITDEEIKTYFDDNKESYSESEQVKASHILVEDETIAKEVKDKLDKGADFAKLAKEYSTDTSNAENGGDLGYFGRGAMVAEFEEVAFSLAENKISDPVKSEFGYHIIQVLDKKEAKAAVYEEHIEEIKSALFDEKFQTEYTTWLEEKKEEYDIENLLT
jgi:foldase protein PrsA